MDNKSPVRTTLSQKRFPLVPLIIYTIPKNSLMCRNSLVSEVAGYGLDGSSHLAVGITFSTPSPKSALESPSLLFNDRRSFFPGDKVGRN
jgi:hypothetical protein